MFDATFIEHLLLSSFLTKCGIKGERLDLAKTVINLQKQEKKKKNSCFEWNHKKSLPWNWQLMRITTKFYWFMVEACVAEWLTPWTPDLEVQGSSFAHCIVSLDKELNSTLSLFTQVYQWVPVTYCWEVTLRWTSILSRMGGEKQRKERSNDQFKAKAHGNFPGPFLFVILLPCSDLI